MFWGNIIRISDFEYEGKLIQTTDSVFKFKKQRCSEEYQMLDGSKNYVAINTNSEKCLGNGDGTQQLPGAWELCGPIEEVKGESSTPNKPGPAWSILCSKNLASSFLLSLDLLISYFPEVSLWTHEFRNVGRIPTLFFQPYSCI